MTATSKKALTNELNKIIMAWLGLAWLGLAWLGLALKVYPFLKQNIARI